MAKPNLALIPATIGDKVYSILPSDGVGDFDFTRASTATRINAQGLIETVASGENRLNYSLLDGEVVGCPHLLLEPQRTNLIRYSEDFSNAWWLKLNNVTVSAEKVISPDGTLNASQLIFDGTSGGRIEKNLTGLTQGADYSVSVYARVSSGTQVVNFGSVNDFEYTLTTEWQRLTSTEAENDTTGFPRLKCNDAATIEVWGFQLEQSSFPTSYIKSNSGGTTTRAAETCNGSGDAATFNDSEGVLMAEISALDNDLTTKYIAIDSSNLNNYILLRYDTVSNNIAVVYKASGLDGVTLTHIVSDVTTFNKVLFKYKDADFSLWINGLEVSTSNAANRISSGNVFNNLTFSVSWNANAHFYGKTKQIQYFDTTDIDLEQLTSWDSFRAMAEGQLYTIE